jgi:uncharacterized damage-inducible protein DinB
MSQQAMVAESATKSGQLKQEVYRSMFEFQSGIFQNALEGLSESNVLTRPSPHANHINWLLGHLLHCRYMLAGMIGAQVHNPFEEMYWNSIEDKSYPKLIEIISRWPEATEKLLSRLSEMTDAELEARTATEKPTLEEMVSFFAYHEAYHLGQIGIVRKIIGLDAMKSH